MLYIDLVSSSTTVSKRSELSASAPDAHMASKRNVGGFQDWMVPHQKASGSFGTVPIVGNLLELDYQPRNSDAATTTDNGYNTFSVSILHPVANQDVD